MSLYFLFSSPCPSCTRVIVLSWQLPLCETGRTNQGVSPAGARNKNRLFCLRLDTSDQPGWIVFAGFKMKRRQSLSSRLVNGNTRVCKKLQHLQSAAAVLSIWQCLHGSFWMKRGRTLVSAAALNRHAVGSRKTPLPAARCKSSTNGSRFQSKSSGPVCVNASSLSNWCSRILFCYIWLKASARQLILQKCQTWEWFHCIGAVLLFIGQY